MRQTRLLITACLALALAAIAPTAQAGGYKTEELWIDNGPRRIYGIMAATVGTFIAPIFTKCSLTVSGPSNATAFFAHKLLIFHLSYPVPCRRFHLRRARKLGHGLLVFDALEADVRAVVRVVEFALVV